MFKKWFLGIRMAIPMLLLSLIAVTPAFAQTGGTVVAGGLNNPRGVAVGDDGSIYVAEAGNGGPNKITMGDATATWGYSSQVTKIAPDGSRSVVAHNIFSVAGGDGNVGLGGILYAGGALWGVTTWLTSTISAPGQGALLRIDPATGATQVVADISAYEVQHNPDGFAINSDPYGLTLGPDSAIYVADAAGNDILRVDPNTVAVSLVAVIPGITVPAAAAPPGGNPERGGANELDPVPTGVQFGANGALYVSLLSGGPFPTGAARVVSVAADGTVSDAAAGLTMVTDFKLGPDGNWYVVEFARFDGRATPPFLPGSGDILRLTASGQRQVVASGLNYPNKIAFDASGNLYATVLSVTPGGQLMRFANVAGSGGGQMPGMPRTGQADVSWLAAVLAAFALLLGGVALRRRAQVR